MIQYCTAHQNTRIPLYIERSSVRLNATLKGVGNKKSSGEVLTIVVVPGQGAAGCSRGRSTAAKLSKLRQCPRGSLALTALRTEFAANA